MKRAACTRTWRAQAVEDGRLSGAERASFERHAVTCAECASEVRALSLGSGEIWTAEREATRAASPPSPPASPSAVPTADPRSSAPAAKAPSEQSPAKARQTALPERQRDVDPLSRASSPTVDTPPDDFARAVAAFGAGDYGQAERLFQDFERRHPQDARQEDATFLRAVARARRGDAAGARAAARQYLERYPQGLRAPEAQQLAESSGTGAR